MRFRFNNMTGRLSPRSLEIPTKFRTGPIQEAPTIHYPVGTTFAKTIAGPKGKFSAVPAPLRQKMTLFQVNNSLPVHVKGGQVDKVLYGVTAVLCAIGVFDCCRVYFDLSYPKDQQSKLIWGK